MARGPYGKDFALENVVPNPLKKNGSWAGESKNGGDAGLQLWLRGDHRDGVVSGAEMATERRDLLYGSYRVGMKLASGGGSCGAFFWVSLNVCSVFLSYLQL